jgi:hypothetical protein
VLIITYKKKVVEIIVIIDPTEATVFHCEYESGKSGIRRGIPANPKKCIGKKQTLTPTNVDQKWILPNTSEYLFPTIFAIQ